MSVLHIAQSTAGGIASYFEEIAAAQTERLGAGKVAFVVPAGAAHVPRLEREEVICFRSADRDPASLADFARTARAAIRRLQPDIVHLHSSFAGAILRPVLALDPARPKIVYCPHGWAFAMEISPARQRAYAFVERQLARVTDLLHVNSQSEFDLAARFGLPTAKMRVLANGISWSPEPSRPAASGPLRIAFIGRLDRQKGFDRLLDTIERFDLPGIHFDIVGDSVVSKSERPRLAERANVTYHGWLSRPETLAILAKADAVLMPSRWDAAPIVATESMRAGIAVIGSNRGAIPEIVGDGVGGLIFDLDEPDALGRLLQSVDRAQLRKLGAGGRRRWERHYTAETMNERTLAAYGDVLAGQAGGRAAPMPGANRAVPG